MKRQWVEEHSVWDEDACLIWPFGKTSAGYGVIYNGGKQILAHRFMCTLAHGAPPPGKTDCAHNCGNGSRGCVNPRHLRWATRSENMADCALHGTRLDGDKNPQAKLTNVQVAAIRNSREKGRFLAQKYGVSPSLIAMIKNGRVWRHLL